MNGLQESFTNRLLLGALGSVLSVGTPLATAADGCDLVLSSSAGQNQSQWLEFSAAGKPLVNEAGNLLMTRLAVLVPCEKAEWRLQSTRTQGERRYFGVTNTHQAATSTTSILDQAIQMDALIPLDPHWSIGLGLEHRRTHRNIHSTPQASGYPELFTQWTGLTGLRYRHSASENTTWEAAAWVGRTLTGQVWLDLPNAEPTRLSLGTGHVVETSLTWAKKKTTESRWTWATTISWRATKTAAGPVSALINNGRLVGTAHQPETNTQSLAISATMQYAF